MYCIIFISLTRVYTPSQHHGSQVTNSMHYMCKCRHYWFALTLSICLRTNSNILIMPRVMGRMGLAAWECTRLQYMCDTQCTSYTGGWEGLLKWSGSTRCTRNTCAMNFIKPPEKWYTKTGPAGLAPRPMLHSLPVRRTPGPPTATEQFQRTESNHEWWSYS